MHHFTHKCNKNPEDSLPLKRFSVSQSLWVSTNGLSFRFPSSGPAAFLSISLLPPSMDVLLRELCTSTVLLIWRWDMTALLFCTFNYTLWSTIFIARQHTDARYWYSNFVRLSVCLSVRDVPVLDENGLTYCHSFFTIRQPNHSKPCL